MCLLQSRQLSGILQTDCMFTAWYQAFLTLNIHNSITLQLNTKTTTCMQWNEYNTLVWVPYARHYKPRLVYTAIPYRASTGPEQGFHCVVFPHREKPVFITGLPSDQNRFFPVRKTTQRKPCFHYRDGFVVYFLPHFSLQFIIESGQCYRQFMY